MAETSPAELHAAIVDEVGTILVGNEDVLEGLTIALLTRGHVLMEGVPGVAKTTIANAFARATGLAFTRIQMTPDILPADITGTHVYREQTGEFELQKGPIFANLVVADEINRATPKTQSALLEAMQERNVTIEGETLALPEPFMVIATQNPIEMEGTFELPEAQRDRFQQKIVVELPERAAERELIARFDAEPTLDPTTVSQVVTQQALTTARTIVADVHVEEAVREYLLDVVRATREAADLEYGASPRATLAVLHTAKARAAIHGRTYVIPDDVKALVPGVLRHRMIPSTEMELQGGSRDAVLERIIDSIAVPETAEIDSDRQRDA